MKTCPTCGQELASPLLFEISALPLTTQQRGIATRLIQSYGQWVSVDQLAWHLYANDPNGGPDNPRRGVYVQMCHLRKHLRETGIKIESRQGSSSGYRLIRDERRAAA